MRIKVRRGTTRSDGSSLCLSCSNAMVVKGEKIEARIECSEIGCHIKGHTVPFDKVVECSAYKDKSLPSLHDMEEIAWVLRTGSGGRKIGFVRARDLKDSERYVLVDEREY